MTENGDVQMNRLRLKLCDNPVFCLFIRPRLLPVFFVLVATFASSRLYGQDSDFIKGADVSFLRQIEDLGGQYYVDGAARDPLDIFRENEFNWMRLKLWHAPAEDYNNLSRILSMASRFKEKGLKFLLNFHYSDTWADPGRQTKPAAWQDLPFEVLTDSVYQYTLRVISALQAQGTPPDMVQIGNEITPGLLWNDGRVGGSFHNWSNLGELINAGIRGVNNGVGQGDSVRIMIHIDRGGDNEAARWFYDNLLNQGVEFDVIGLSFYPWWHGTLDALRVNLNNLAFRYDKDIVVVETAYPWTLSWLNDGHGNIVGNSSQVSSGYPATVDGQKMFLRDLIGIIRDVPNAHGKGLFYWEPEYISVPPIGSPWENLALFDFEGNALGSFEAFRTVAPGETIDVTIRLNTATHFDTLRPGHFVQIRGAIEGSGGQTLADGRRISWNSDSDLQMVNMGGDYWEITFPLFVGDRLSYKFWTGFDRDSGTFLRLGWEGPITAYDGSGENARIFVAGESDTTLPVQFYNSLGTARSQYWAPYETKADSVAIYFRVNMAGAMATNRFEPAVNGPVAVRCDEPLDWESDAVILSREEASQDNGGFWSGALYISRPDVTTGQIQHYGFYIHEDSEGGWENNVAERSFPYPQGNDTTLSWVYFDNQPPVAVSVQQSESPSQFFRLFPNYPNPFNPSTVFRFRIGTSAKVDLSVFDLQGRLVCNLLHRQHPPGDYTVVWDGMAQNGVAAASGVYLVRMTADAFQTAGRILLLR